MDYRYRLQARNSILVGITMLYNAYVVDVSCKIDNKGGCQRGTSGI